MNTSNEVIAEIRGYKKDWHFVINDTMENKIGIINKKGRKKRKVLFRSHHDYNIIMDEICTNIHNKMVIVSSAMAIHAMQINTL
ncbi:hypothetical protein [Flavobacterium sp. KACC 22761]|uniref:hypothetical protein n=1 Tax=Flavobacterium sp. KACC 22761 TaxID=3092665 RepID=UPI002A751347|nr:hypothetical protein [Flavobacterium sp. KACC 22761]WPO78468.1 hypothetical protein SCB73_19595 [Flavobacterium sp. KACC 22761]